MILVIRIIEALTVGGKLERDHMFLVAIEVVPPLKFGNIPQHDPPMGLLSPARSVNRPPNHQRYNLEAVDVAGRMQESLHPSAAVTPILPTQKFLSTSCSATLSRKNPQPHCEHARLPIPLGSTVHRASSLTGFTIGYNYIYSVAPLPSRRGLGSQQGQCRP